MPGAIFSGGTLIDDTSGQLTTINSSGNWIPTDVWTEQVPGQAPSSSGSGWGGFFGQLAAAGANIGLAFAQKDLQGNGYAYNNSPFTFGPGYHAPQASAQTSLLTSGAGGLLVIALIVLVLIKVLK